MDFFKTVDHNWSLFLDRDGVINYEKDQDYIRNVSEFIFYEGVPEVFAKLKGLFNKIIIVTNQRGIGKGLMSEEDLRQIHQHMVNSIIAAGGHIDAIYYAPDLDSDAPNRKPNPGMALSAQRDFPDIDFEKSIMIGNNISDMEFGKNCGMKTVFVRNTNPTQPVHAHIDLFCQDLVDFSNKIVNL